MKHHIYHHNDMDGHASGALVGLGLERQGVNPRDVLYYEIDYGKEFDDTVVDYNNDKVYMVDFSLQPLERMRELINKAHFTWIDHHKTSITWADQQPKGSLNYIGVLREGDKAACELVWEHYFEGPCPKFIKMISHYDIWNKESEHNWTDKILPLNMYFETIETRPGYNITWWRSILQLSELFPGDAVMKLDDWVKAGNILKEFNDNRMRKLTLEHGYEDNFHGHKAFILNSLEGGSLQFEVAVDTTEYEILVAYRQFKNEYWVVNLYSTDSDMDCGSLAKELGNEGPFKNGGGHPGAAGFQTDTKHLFDLIHKT